ncbi:glycosyltransferase family 2 protein [Dactylosporangium sp. CA-139066]|uniref:glycosyltransferase family 2 protein n=1 Tax=Dactylosporangium sp. CA-139066 TaxID=3239930 RepID=UPI003D8CB9D2
MIVLLPVYLPDSRLTELAAALRAEAPAAHVVIIDDGSGPSAAGVLDAAGRTGAAVLRQAAHRGKGAALKAGLRHVADAVPGRTVVTADGDGQHRVEDILRVGRHAGATNRIALGARRFDTAVPPRSRIGNALTGALFRAATGRRIRDTQTGLRGFPAATLPWLCSIPGDGFDYEMNVLLAAVAAGRELDEVEVSTTYLDGNSGSHFAPLADSLRVYRPLLRHALSRATGAPTQRAAPGAETASPDAARGRGRR